MRSKFKWILTLVAAFLMQFSFAQEKTISGTVSGDGMPLPGATVLVKGTKNGTTTDFDGKYSIKAKQGDVLEFSYVGFKKKTASVSSSNTLNVVLDADNVLEDVVITGYKTVIKTKSNVAAATIASELIENRPDANIMNTLQGQLPGVNITAATGQPGAKSEVIIRGLATLNGNSDPLYVIDGFPTNADNFRSLNPNDIENVTVLKDAAATSQFGNRGTNGVILIQTRRASLGESRSAFRYSGSYGVAQLQAPKYVYANARQSLTLENRFGSGRGATLTDAEIAAWDIDTDWVDYFFQQASTTMHNLSFENSGKNLSSFTSLGYTEQDGILKTTRLQRFNIRNNIDGKSANEKFNYQVSTSFGYSKNNEATNLGEGAVNRNYVLGAYISAPYLSPSAYEGSQWTYDQFAATSLLATPYMLIDKLNTYANLTEEARFDIATNFSYKLSKDFTVTNRINALYLTNRFFQAEFPDSFNAILFSSTPGTSVANGGNFNGFEDINQRREINFNYLAQLNYSKDFNKHSISANVNMEYNAAHLNSNNFRQRGLNPLTFVPNTGAGYVLDIGTHDFYVPSVSASRLRNDLISYFSILDYDYDNKYGLGFTVRRDGSSRFLSDTRWGTFWSVSGRWNLDKEKFISDISFIDALKMRASYGTTGNQRFAAGTIFAGIIPPPYINSFGVTNNTYNGQLGTSINFGYPLAQWETTKQFNIGIDFAVLKNKLSGSIDFYNRRTEDLFNDEPTSSVFGANTIRRNSEAIITNKGLELNLLYNVVKNKDFSLMLRANGSYNKNSVDGIRANEGRIILSDGAGYSYITQNGGSIFEAFVYPYAGVNPANGNSLFLDINNNLTENPTAADRRATGKNSLPTYQGGFGFDADYKGFFLSTTFTYVLDSWRFDVDEENLYDVSSIGQFRVGADLLNSWTPTNLNSVVPSLTATNNGAIGNSDRFLRDASYLRLRNVQLGYRVPSRYLEGMFISSLSFNVQAQNLFTITKWKGFDAESNRVSDFYQYPTPRIYTFGVDLKF